MSEPPPVVREATIREIQPGMAGALTELARAIVTALPPSFLGLLLVNVLFLWVLFQHLDHQATARAAAINKMLDHCLARPYTPPGYQAPTP